MKFKVVFSLTYIFILSINGIIGQEVFRYYDSMDYLDSLKKIDNNIEIEMNKIEKYIENFSYTEDENNYKSIPVVFHILPGVNLGNDIENIIRNQLDIVNSVFRGETQIIDHINDPFNVYSALAAANIELEICLAKYDEFGNSTNAIIKYDGEQKEWGINNEMKNPENGGVNPWLPNRYLNIWVCDLLAENHAGFAQLPGGPDSVDGIVIDYKYLGINRENIQKYRKGYTLIHLLGNYLGLYPLWGTSKCSDDFVSDTPIHNSMNQGCNQYQHLTTCADYLEVVTAMNMNFMDSSDDECMYMLTKLQKARIHAVLSDAGPRSELIRSENSCQPLLRNKMFSQITSTIKPNPSNGKIWINLGTDSTEDFQLKISNTNGKVKIVSTITKENNLIKGGERLIPGLYLYNVLDSKNRVVSSGKFVKI